MHIIICYILINNISYFLNNIDIIYFLFKIIFIYMCNIIHENILFLIFI